MRAQGAISPRVNDRRAARVAWPRRRRAVGRVRASVAIGDAWSVPAAVALIVGVSLVVGMVGADARWLAVLGHDIARAGAIPAGIPFAAAPTVHWHNTIVLAELIFAALEGALGDRGLVLAQAVAVAVAFGVLAKDSLHAGAGRRATASTCLIAALGLAPSLAIVRAQLFSLALFPLLLLLLRGDTRTRSGRIWLVPLLLAIWSNLHGAVLAGLLVTLIYFAVARVRDRPLETVAVGFACLGALCANPAGLGAVAYYHGVLTNAAAERGDGMWGPLSPTSPADALLIAAVAVLALRARRGRPSAWEVAAALALGAMTLHASRSGLWLLLLLVTPAALGTPERPPWDRRVPVLAALAAVCIVVGLVRGPAPNGAEAGMVARAIALAGHTPILASDIPAEQIALAGGRVWTSDPIDAFRHDVQVAYLEWMDGERAGLTAIGAGVRVVLVARGSPEARVMGRAPGFRLVTRGVRSELFERTTNG